VTAPVPAEVSRAAARYLAQADLLLPGRIVGFYLVGSTALGAYRPGRSDIDFVAVLDGGTSGDLLRRLRALHVVSAASSASVALVRGRSPLSGTLNGVFVDGDDLSAPVSAIAPVAAHVGTEFERGRAGDLFPVDWKVLAEQGIAVRGPEPGALGLDPEPEQLVAWNLRNLDEYWRPWARRTRHVRSRWATAWGMLGPPRLHCTIATGDIVSKEAAGEYARDVFGARWHPLLDDALGYVRGERSTLAMARAERCRATSEFVVAVADDALRLVAA
jgi:hypothetical protein